MTLKRIFHRTVMIFLGLIPMASHSATVGYSPSIPGQPLIFHINTIQISQFSGATWAQLQNALLIQSSYAHHMENLSYRECCGQWDLWADGMGQWLHQNTNSHEQFGYSDFTGGFTLGADKCYKDFLVGAAFSYTNSSMDWNESAGNGQINSYYGGLYARWSNGFYYVNGSALGAYNDYNTSRHVRLRRVERQANSSHQGGEALAGVEFGVMFKKLFCNIDLVPFVDVDYVYLAQQGYREDNAGNSNLQVDSRNDQLLQSEGGLKFLRRIFCGGWIIAPNLSLSYINQTPLTGSSYEITFIRSSRHLRVDGWNFERNLGALGFHLNFTDCKGISSFTFGYEGQYGGNYWNQIGSLECNLRF